MKTTFNARERAKLEAEFRSAEVLVTDERRIVSELRAKLNPLRPIPAPQSTRAPHVEDRLISTLREMLRQHQTLLSQAELRRNRLIREIEAHGSEVPR